MEIEKLKRKAYEILKKLKTLTDKNDLASYLKLKQDFQALMPFIFGSNYVKNKNYDKWDLARNQLDNIFSFKMRYNSGKMDKRDYENYRKKFEGIFSELVEELEKGL